MRSTIEIATPQSLDLENFIAGLANLANCDAIILEENGGLDSITAASALKQRCDKEIFLKIACRDRNRIALHSFFLTASSLGLLKVVLVDGAHPTQTPFTAAKPVYDLDPLNLLRMLKSGSGFTDELESPLKSQPWTIGVRIGGFTKADMMRAKKFAAAGADLFFTSSLESVPLLKEITDKRIFLCVPEEETADIAERQDETQSAGAHGISVMVKASDRVIDGSLTRK